MKKSQHCCVSWALHQHLSPPCSDFARGRLEDRHQTNIKCNTNFNMYFCYEQMDADGNFKNWKVRKERESSPLNSSIPRTFGSKTTNCEASKGY